MAGVMHPVGPEPAETYWRRRALVVGVFLVVLIAVLVLLFNLGGSPGQAAPVDTRSGAPAGGPTSPSAEPTGSASPSSAPVASPTPTAPTPAGPTAHHSRKPAPVTACTSADLKATLTSRAHQVGIGDRVDFDVSYVNRTDQPCEITVGPGSFDLTITSGIDRIWSTADCARLVPSKKTTLKPGHGVGWSVSWNGKRSLAGATCKNRPEIPRAGYYHADAELAGAQAPDYLLVLR